MQLIRKITVLVLFAMLAFPSSASAQGYGQEIGPPGMGGGMGGPGMGMGGMMGGYEPSKLDLAKQQLMKARTDQQRKKLVTVIRNELAGQYDKYLKQNQAQINRLQKRLDGLKKQLKTRVDAKDQLVTLELTRIVNESQGLSWPSNQPNDGPGYADDFSGEMTGMEGGMSGAGYGAGMDMGGMGVGGLPGGGGGVLDNADYDPSPIDEEASKAQQKRLVATGFASPNSIKSKETDSASNAQKNLLQIGLACHSFESNHKRFPSNLVDTEDKPLLSWRVAILPFLGQKKLYDRFRHDEPWNSEHNIALLGEMPDVYESENFENKLKTLIQGFNGGGTVFESGAKVTFMDMKDGSSNTILCVESAEDKAVIWTKPQDLKVGADTKVKDLFRFDGLALGLAGRPGLTEPPQLAAVVRCDGSTGLLLSVASEEQTRNLITYDDGEVVDNGSLFLEQ